MQKTDAQFDEQLRKMEPILSWFVSTHPIPGLDPEDYRQELRIRVWDAWRDYDPDAATMFTTFAYKYVRNSGVSLYRKAICLKRRESMKLNINLEDADEYSEDESISIPYTYRSTEFKDQYTSEMIRLVLQREALHNPDEFLRTVYKLKLKGWSNDRIAKEINSTPYLVRKAGDTLRNQIRAALEDVGIGA